MNKFRFQRVVMGATALMALGFAGAANAAPQPGSKAATAALSFDPFAKKAASGEGSGSGTLVIATGSAALQAPVMATAAATQSQPLPGTTVSIGDITVVEPDSGRATVFFTVTLSRASPVPVRVDFRTRSGEARGGGLDYVDASGTVTIPAGSQSQTIGVQIVGDRVTESTERFYVELNNARPSPVTIARRTGTGTILDNDPRQPRQPRITIAVQGSNSIAEGNSGQFKAVGFLVYLSESPSQDVRFNYDTANGTALNGSDYGRHFGQQGFRAGERQLSRGFQVPIYGDNTREANETFTARIFNVQNATVATGSVQITIRNDD